MPGDPVEGGMVRRGRQPIQKAASGKHRSAGADRSHDLHLPVHLAEPFEQGRNGLRVRRLVEQRPRPGAAWHHQHIERLLKCGGVIPVRRDGWPVDTLHAREVGCDQDRLKGIGRRRSVSSPKKARDRESLDEPEDIDRFEAVEDKDAYSLEWAGTNPCETLVASC